MRETGSCFITLMHACGWGIFADEESGVIQFRVAMPIHPEVPLGSSFRWGSEQLAERLMPSQAVSLLRVRYSCSEKTLSKLRPKCKLSNPLSSIEASKRFEVN